ncbi:MAG: GTP cyclohydrolase II, partial [Alphaproteobacteria bacterium]|nr:GTP cyclohydrolase II [Alphaproteobacteria bacterium]
MNPRMAARAIDALHRGWPVTVSAGGSRYALLAIESASDDALEQFDPAGAADILISASRAETLKLTNQFAAANPDRGVLIERTPWLDLLLAMALADPVQDLGSPLKGPFRAKALDAPDAATAALKLARLAGILPAFFLRSGDVPTEVTTDAVDIEAYDDAARLAIATRARLPVAVSENTEIIAFRSPEEPQEHVALIIGQRDASVPVVRLHSECLT